MQRLWTSLEHCKEGDPEENAMLAALAAKRFQLAVTYPLYLLVYYSPNLFISLCRKSELAAKRRLAKANAALTIEGVSKSTNKRKRTSKKSDSANLLNSGSGSNTLDGPQHSLAIVPAEVLQVLLQLPLKKEVFQLLYQSQRSGGK
ncbi:uncharacterized protein LOC133909914 [Phragmites australis]|uniref:uncharacterized protein LOC133909914 n=1 Tax=Phragmites australis TaxID=29695 RepID=UPI002D772AD0|nr:uncharacterized protein LOC133909914 [Phragmites australis]